MKFLIVFLMPMVVVGQDSVSVFRKQATDNLFLVANDYRLRSRVQIDKTGIVVYRNVDRDTVMFSVDWKEVPKFIEIVENWNLKTMCAAFENRANVPFVSKDVKGEVSTYKPLPVDWHGLRVALDPGHFAGTMAEAIYEDRYVKVHGKELGVKKDVAFFEAEFTFGICLLLKKMIEDRGGLVVMTRPEGAGALGHEFDDWMRLSYKSALASAHKDKQIGDELYEALKDTSDKKFIFNNFYKNLDFRKRVEIINSFHPDVTIGVHLNAKEGNVRMPDGYLHPVADDYNMVFIPGGFLNDELVKTDQKIDFLRLLVSPDISNSLNLSKCILSVMDSITKVPSIPAANGIYALRDLSVYSGIEGVYARNLAITRMSRGTVVYLEALYQDNVNEVKLLSDRRYSVSGYYKRYFIPERCKEIAESVLLGLDRYLEGNRVMAKGTAVNK